MTLLRFLRRAILGLFRRIFVYWVPFCPTYDRIYTLCRFVFFKRRWPARYLYNDRLVRLKLDGELLDPLRQMLTDKISAKRYVEALLGLQYVSETYAVLASRDEVYDYDFPKECVVKPSHASRKVLLVRDGIVDKRIVASWLNLDYYKTTREQNYVFIRPRIIVEEFVFGPDTMPDDYKVICVGGVPKAILVFHDRFGGMTHRYYDTAWNPQPFGLADHPMAEERPQPANLGELLRIAATLAKGLSIVRVDLYTNNSVVKFGEVTNCPSSSHMRFTTPEGERQLSKLLFGQEM